MTDIDSSQDQGSPEAVVTWTHPDGIVHIQPLPNGKARIRVTPGDPAAFMLYNNWETSYPLELIRAVYEYKGPLSLCDEIMREEDHAYVGTALEKSLRSYLPPDAFEGRRILDFGCGSGGSTINLVRLFPGCQTVGVELESKAVEIAKRRASHYGLSNVRFLASPSGSELPPGLPDFDYAILCAVYEHLLPDERESLLSQIWRLIKPGGILFVLQTPYRYFPIESHTTALPFISYLPPRLALAYARTFSRRVARDESWETLLRKGIRGGSKREIRRRLRDAEGHPPTFLEPRRLGVRDHVDLWYQLTPQSFPRRAVYYALKAFRLVSGIALVPRISLAIQKVNGPADAKPAQPAVTR